MEEPREERQETREEEADRRGLERARKIGKVLAEIWDRRPGLRSGRKLYLAAIKSQAGKQIIPPIKETEVRSWVRLEPRQQKFLKKWKEWPGRNQIANGPNVRWNMDVLDLSQTSDDPSG